MVEVVAREVPPLMPDVRFLLLRHPLARGSLCEAPNATDVTVPYEANGPGTLLMLGRIVDLSGVDLFHAPSNILPAGLPMRTVVTIHDTMWLTDPLLCGAEGIWGKVQTWFYRNGLRRAIADADHIVAISEATRRDVVAHDATAVDRCTVIPHGVDGKFVPAVGASDREHVHEVRNRYAPGAKRHVLMVGRAAPYKNQTRGLLAFLAAFARDSGTHLIIVQRLGHEGDRFRSLAHRAGAGDRVHVVPPMPEADLIALYRGALCLCHPSLKEGWGMPVGEAMACGCPVVTSNTSAMPEVAGDAALYVTPTSVGEIAHALTRIAGDGRLQASMAQAGLRRVGRFSWALHARRTAALFRRLLETSRDARRAA